MDKELNKLLKRAYDLYKDVEYPPVPIPEIKEFLTMEGIDLNSKNKKDLI